jgi:hypothetical protein
VRRVAFATVAAKRHLSLARVLAESARRHHPDVPFFVALADEVDGYFDPASEPFQMLRLEELDVPALPRLRFHYSQPELTYAVTPSLLRHLLDRGFAAAAFLKQESLVVGDLGSALALLERSSIVLTPHLLAPLDGHGRSERELNILQSGVYNVGFLGVAATASARAFLAWWAERVALHCRRDVAHGMHFEQRWLDLVPALFPEVAVVRDPGFNIGHWNLPERAPRRQGGGFTLGGAPCSFVRFSGFDFENPQAVTRYSARLSVDDLGDAAELFHEYVRRLEAAGYRETSTWPYAYDRFDNGAAVSDEMRAAYRDLGEPADRFGDPLRAGDGRSFLRWFTRRRRRQRLLRLPRRIAGLATETIRRAAALARGRLVGVAVL